jgi:hypothetical protein
MHWDMGGGGADDFRHRLGEERGWQGEVHLGVEELQ